ncbi:7-cyano-7-deazaguanine synthase QueC [Candidatus Peregrinibacteria bacterium]|nr:7-cyano-7-deazaguanine synthase QueC [Candidatus Peregrinibacteria bacterium]
MIMKTVLVYSGGMDSTTLLYKLLAQGDRVLCLSFNYGQRHKKELRSAEKICRILQKNGKKITQKIVNITAMKNLMASSALTSKIKVPEGHYKSKTMRATVVPNRNMIFLALAIAAAVSGKFSRVAIAVHAGDHAIYPDCRPEFIKAMNAVSKIANYKSIKIYAPFLNMTKREIAKIGRCLGVPYELTWTCYKGLKNPCEKCGACRERNEAFNR